MNTSWWLCEPRDNEDEKNVEIYLRIISSVFKLYEYHVLGNADVPDSTKCADNFINNNYSAKQNSDKVIYLTTLHT